MAPRGPAAVLVLAVIAATLTWAHLAVAALSVCLNESPALATDLAEALPIAQAIARWLLPWLAPLGVSPGASPACDAAAPARAMAVAGLAYLIGIFALDLGRVSNRVAWPVVIGVAAISRVALLCMPALLSSDIIDYATHGRVASLHGANPYEFTPSQFPSDPLSNLGAWPRAVTVYGPLWTHIDAAVTGALPNASLVQLVFAYKTIGLLADVVSAVLIMWIAARWRRLGATRVTPLVALATWVLNPVVNIELIGNAHNEALMFALVLAGFALLTLAVERGSRQRMWLAALVAFWLGALVKFVPAAVDAIVALVWLRAVSQRLLRLCLLVLALVVISLVVSAPWLDSPAVAAPVVGLASGGQRFKDVWQDALAAWLTVRVVPLLGVPDDPATLRMDVARALVWSLTRGVFAAYLLVEAWLLWRRASFAVSFRRSSFLSVSIRQQANSEPDEMLRSIASAILRVLLLALLLYTSQVYTWYFLWPLPMACLLGPRNAWSRAVLMFGLTFLPAYYLREFAPYGVFEMPRYAEIALAALAAIWLAPRLWSARHTSKRAARAVTAQPASRSETSCGSGGERSEAIPP